MEYKDLALHYLQRDFEDNKPTVIFAGAGVNQSPEMDMSWNSIMDFLFKRAIQILAVERDIPSEDVDTVLETVTYSAFRDKTDEFSKEWKDLFMLCNDKLPQMVRASIIKQIFNGNYISEVQYFLYKDCDAERLNEIFKEYYSLDSIRRNKGIAKQARFHTLYQLARLIVLCPNIKAVVTYNYDNFMSQAIKILVSEPEIYFDGSLVKKVRRLKAVDIYGSRHSEMSPSYPRPGTCGDGDRIETINIFHPHGYIPPPTEIIENIPGDIVLSMDEYYESSRNVYSWQTSSQLHFLSHYTCIFAGFSFNDINIQRLIYYAGECGNDDRIYYLYADTHNKVWEQDEEYKKYRNAYSAILSIADYFYTSYGLTTIYNPNGWYELYQSIGKIADNYVKHR